MVTRSLALGLAAGVLLPVCAYAQGQEPAPMEVQQISELNAWTVGALSRANGALPGDIWNRSDPAFLAAAFDRLPANYDSPAAMTLARRVLLSGAEAPRGDASVAARKRFEALGRMGAADELATMASGAGSAATDVAIAQYAAQAELARNQRAQACNRGRAAVVGEQVPPFLLRLRAYCAAVGGDRAAGVVERAVERAAAFRLSASARTAAAPRRPGRATGRDGETNSGRTHRTHGGTQTMARTRIRGGIVASTFARITATAAKESDAECTNLRNAVLSKIRF